MLQKLSKRQACVELAQNVTTSGEAELVSCHIWDLDSLNKTKLNQTITLKSGEKFALKLSDSIEFGSLKFKLSTVSPLLVSDRD